MHIIACMFSIQFKHAIIIVAVDCGELRDPAGGSVTTVGTRFESTAEYTCNVGFILIGNLRRTCQAKGQWSGSEPACTSGYKSLAIFSLSICYSMHKIMHIIHKRREYKFYRVYSYHIPYQHATHRCSKRIKQYFASKIY
jgi:hypothetical protein